MLVTELRSRLISIVEKHIKDPARKSEIIHLVDMECVPVRGIFIEMSKSIDSTQYTEDEKNYERYSLLFLLSVC